MILESASLLSIHSESQTVFKARPVKNGQESGELFPEIEALSEITT